MSSRILVVDDNDDLAGLLAEWLTSEGHQVRVVQRAADALRVAQELRPDLALVDLGLPDADGTELGHQLRRLRHEICLLAMSGLADERTRLEAEHAGFDAFLAKPLDVDRLQHFITCLAGSA